jgi:ribose transport system substrate-binding protein
MSVKQTKLSRRRFCVTSAAALACVGLGAMSSSLAFAGSTSVAAAIVQKFANTPIGWEGPTAPVPMARNKKLVVIALTMTSVSNQRVSAGIKEAAKLGGWEVNIIDGQGLQDKFAGGIDSAIAQGASGIVLMGTQYVPEALERAKAAKIPHRRIDRHHREPVLKAGYYAHMVAERGKEIGAAAAAQLVADLGPSITVATFSAARGDPLGDLLTQGANDVFKASGNSVAVDLTLEFSELGTGTIGQKAVAAVQAHPEIKGFWVSWDAPAAEIITAFGNAGIQVPIYATYADPQDIDFMRSGRLQKADVAVPLEWDGWAVVDNFNRIFNGTPVPPAANDGVPIKLLNTTNVNAALPYNATAWQGEYDFRAKYKELWGIK